MRWIDIALGVLLGAGLIWASVYTKRQREERLTREAYERGRADEKRKVTE